MSYCVVVKTDCLCSPLAVYSWYTHWYWSEDIYCSGDRSNFFDLQIWLRKNNR